MPPWRNGRRDRLKIYCPLRVCQFESDRRYQKQNLVHSQPTPFKAILVKRKTFLPNISQTIAPIAKGIGEVIIYRIVNKVRNNDNISKNDLIEIRAFQEFKK